MDGGWSERGGYRPPCARFGEIIGLAFQLADDLHDVTSTPEEMGKAVAKDAAHGKGTLVALEGVDAVRAEFGRLVDEAAEVLSPWGARSERLIAAAHFVCRAAALNLFVERELED